MNGKPKPKPKPTKIDDKDFFDKMEEILGKDKGKQNGGVRSKPTTG